MIRNEKTVISAKDYGLSKNLTNQSTMTNNNPKKILFQWHCSFCLRELPNGGIRFDGVGACPNCSRLAHRLVNGLRMHWTNYFSNLGGV